jgi:hypothetical protein
MTVSETAKRPWRTAVSDDDDRVILSRPPRRDGRT